MQKGVRKAHTAVKEAVHTGRRRAKRMRHSLLDNHHIKDAVKSPYSYLAMFLVLCVGIFLKNR